MSLSISPFLTLCFQYLFPHVAGKQVFSFLGTQQPHSSAIHSKENKSERSTLFVFIPSPLLLTGSKKQKGSGSQTPQYMGSPPAVSPHHENVPPLGSVTEKKLNSMETVMEISKTLKGLPVRKQQDIDRALEALGAKGASQVQNTSELILFLQLQPIKSFLIPSQCWQCPVPLLRLAPTFPLTLSSSTSPALPTTNTTTPQPPTPSPPLLPPLQGPCPPARSGWMAVAVVAVVVVVAMSKTCVPVVRLNNSSAPRRGGSPSLSPHPPHAHHRSSPCRSL